MNVSNIEKNWEIYQKLALSISSKAGVKDLLDKCGEQIIITPYKDRDDWWTAAPGGLIYHSLLVLKHAKNVAKSSAIDVNPESLATVCLFHDIGKIGDPSGKPYFLEQESSWHRERGQLYTYNPNIQKMTFPHRSLYVLQRFGIALEPDEFVTIMTSGGQGLEENRFYGGGETKLSMLFNIAQTLAAMEEKRNI